MLLINTFSCFTIFSLESLSASRRPSSFLSLLQRLAFGCFAVTKQFNRLITKKLTLMPLLQATSTYTCLCHMMLLELLFLNIYRRITVLSQTTSFFIECRRWLCLRVDDSNWHIDCRNVSVKIFKFVSIDFLISVSFSLSHYRDFQLKSIVLAGAWGQENEF